MPCTPRALAHEDAAPLPEPERASFAPLPEWTAPLVWTPQGKRPFYRFVAHLLIRLLVLAPMPAECQVWAFYFPASLLASLTPSQDPPKNPSLGEERAREKRESAGPAGVSSPAASARPGVCLAAAGERTRAVRILFGTAYMPWGGDNPLGGVKTAALAHITLITSVREDPVLLAANRKSIEPQTVAYKAIFPPAQIETSELEIVKVTEAAESVIRRFTVSVDGDGKGSYTIPAEIDHAAGSVIKARLAINRQKESDKPPMAPRVLYGEAFDLEPKGPETVAINGEGIEFAATNGTLADRLEKDPDAPVPAFTWAGRGLRRETAAGREAIYSGELAPVGSISVDEIRLMKGDTILARSGPLTITPGPPWTMKLTAGPPLQTPSGVPGLVPADGKSELVLTLEDVKDDDGLQGGNIVDDGTPIAWSIVEGDGELLGTENSVTVGGRATVRYRSGIEPGKVTIRAALPHPGLGEVSQTVVVTQAKLIIKMTSHFPLIEASVDSEGAGLPDNRAEVGWSAGRGYLAAQEELRNGRALASWTEWPASAMRTPLWRGRFIPIGVTVGREMAGFMYDTRQSFDKTPRSGLKLRMGTDRLAPRSTQSFVPSTTTLEIAGGEPGAPVRVALGTSRFPVIEPVAAYSFDGLTDGVAADLYGRFPAEVSGEVTLDTSDEVHGPGTYQFAGGGQVSVPHTDALALRQNLGFGGWVHFDGLAPGQKLIEKAGAYGVELVSEAGEPRLEFYVLSGGQRARVLSRDVVSAGTWLQFAAQFRGGVLTLALGDNDMIAIGGSSGPADPSNASLVIGEGLTGRLDEIAVYDFSQEPFLTFVGGGTDRMVTLDQEGSATLDVEASEEYASASGLASALSLYPAVVLPPAGSAEDGFRQRLRTPPVRIHEAPEGPEREDFDAALKVETEKSIKTCAEGIGLGEGELWSQQMACDVSVGLIPGATTPQAARDLAVSGIHLARGKRSLAQFVKVGFSVAILAASVIPAGGEIGKVFAKVRTAITGTKAEAILAKEALEKIEMLAKTPGIVVRESGVARVLAAEGGDLGAQDALRYLLGVCETSTCLSLTEDGIHAFERVGTRVGHDELAKGLATIAKDGRFGMDVAERMVGALDRTPTISKLSADALEGLAVFIRHAKGQKRLWSLWDELTSGAFHGLPPEQAQQVAERLFGMLKQGEVRFAETAWWHNFVALGAGTSRHRTSTRGFFHALEQILKEAPGAIISVDARAVGFLGRPDLLVRISVQGAEGIVHKEFKAIGEKYLLRGSDIAQLRRIIKAAKDAARVDGRRVNPDRLKENLQRLVYVFRGPEREDLKKQLLQEAQKALRGKEFRPLAQEIYNNVKFTGTLPF